MTTHRVINVEIFYNKDDTSIVALEVRSNDGKPMSAQEILDSIVETLTHCFDGNIATTNSGNSTLN